MSNETYPHPPTEPEEAPHNIGPLETSADSNGGDAPPPEQLVEGTVEEGDVGFVSDATEETSVEEYSLRPPGASSVEEEEIKLLLPAWSASTLNNRSRPAAPPLQDTQPERRSVWRSCFAGVIVAIIVISLLGTSIYSLIWFWNTRSERVAEVEAILHSNSEQPSADFSGENRPTIDDEGESDRLPEATLAAAQGDPVNRILFVNQNRQIETISPDGGDQRQLTSGARSYIFPAWSADGRHIAAIGAMVSGAGIYVMPDEAETDALEEVYFSSDESPFYLYWAPDSQQITFLANNRAADISLNVTDVDAQNDSRVIALGSPMYWNWTADSRRMLVHSGSESDDSRLVMIDVFGQPQAPRVTAPGPFQAPGISPSGRYWAYSQFQAGGNTWLVIDDRLNGTQNSRRHAGSVAFNWSPTRDELAFISGEGDNAFSSWGPLRLMNAETGAMRLLSAETVLAFFWSPDGNKIATISVPPQNIFGEQFEVRDAKSRRLARYAPGATALPAAQIGTHALQINVIDVASGEGLQLVEAGVSAVFLSQFMPYFDQYALSHQIWSPDSNMLVLPLTEGRQSSIHVIDTRNGRTTPLVEGSIGFWSRQ